MGNSEVLKPCPFCGSSAKIFYEKIRIVDSEIGIKTDEFYPFVACENRDCCASNRDYTFASLYTVGPGAHSKIRTRSDAIEQWNRRFFEEHAGMKYVSGIEPTPARVAGERPWK